MLENSKFSRIGYFIVIGLLVCAVTYMSYRIGGHEWEMKSIRIQRNWTEGENKSLKDLNKNYVEGLQYYQAMLKNARQMTEDVTVMLKKGTIVIPPVEQPTPPS